MKIICQNCNKRGQSKLTSGSFREKRYSESGQLWIQRVCDKCAYVNDEWQAPSDALMDKLGLGFSESEKLVQVENSKSQLIKLENNPAYHEKIIYSDEQMAGFISAEEFFKQGGTNEL